MKLIKLINPEHQSVPFPRPEQVRQTSVRSSLGRADPALEQGSGSVTSRDPSEPSFLCVLAG